MTTYDALSLSKHWLTQCLSSHKLCNRPTADHVPTRLICVSASEPYLCITSQLEGKPEYVTLSHCCKEVPPSLTLADDLFCGDSAAWSSSTLVTMSHKTWLDLTDNHGRGKCEISHVKQSQFGDFYSTNPTRSIVKNVPGCYRHHPRVRNWLPLDRLPLHHSG